VLFIQSECSETLNAAMKAKIGIKLVDYPEREVFIINIVDVDVLV